MFGHAESKGASLMTASMFVKEKFGEEGYKKWLEALKPNVRNDFENGILASKWYPMIEYFSEPLKAICDLFFHGNLQGAFDKGYYSAQYALRGVYSSVIVKIFNTETVISKSSLIFSMSWRPCELKIAESDNRHIIIHLTKFPDITKYVEMGMAGYITALGEKCGVKNVKVTIKKSLTSGDPYTELYATWTQ